MTELGNRTALADRLCRVLGAEAARRAPSHSGAGGPRRCPPQPPPQRAATTATRLRTRARRRRRRGDGGHSQAGGSPRVSGAGRQALHGSGVAHLHAARSCSSGPASRPSSGTATMCCTTCGCARKRRRDGTFNVALPTGGSIRAHVRARRVLRRRAATSTPGMAALVVVGIDALRRDRRRTGELFDCRCPAGRLRGRRSTRARRRSSARLR